MMASITLLILYGAGISLGVSLTAGKWVERTALIVAAWTAVLTALAARAYARDTQRV